MNKERILIKIFRRRSNHGFIGFHAAFFKNNSEYLEHKGQAIAEIGYSIAVAVKKCSENGISATIQFPREVFEIECSEDVVAALFYEPVSEAEIKVFWDRFCKGLSLKD